MGKLNIFRNPFIDTQVAMLIDAYDEGLRRQTEFYWRNKIAKEIEEFGKIIDSTIPLSQQETQHGEYFLKHWTQYVINNCIKVCRGENDKT